MSLITDLTKGRGGEGEARELWISLNVVLWVMAFVDYRGIECEAPPSPFNRRFLSSTRIPSTRFQPQEMVNFASGNCDGA
jgi:hypothetical protein